MIFTSYLSVLCIILIDYLASAATSTAKNTVPQITKNGQYEIDCGCRPIRREPRTQRNSKAYKTSTNERQAKIISGAHTRDGQFPWQASLELLHPSMGFLGHWCGAVLIHQYWILSAAHCVHNDLFNLPIPPLWTVVLGEHNRNIESGYEQRIPVEKILLHKRYHNFMHDLVLMKLSKPADLTNESNIRRICLPFLYSDNGSTEIATHENDGMTGSMEDPLEIGLADVPDKMDNFLRSAQNIRRHHRNATLPSMKDLMSTKILSRVRNAQKQQQQLQQRQQQQQRFRGKDKKHKGLRLTRRRNDKLMKLHTNSDDYDDDLIQQKQHIEMEDFIELPYVDCIATGWGKTNITGDLTELLLKTSVPLHNNGRCKEAYGSFVKIHQGHLCAGKLNGKGGTCVGDSGGPLQCRLTKNGPWILAGITSFGSGCAIEGFPDVYTRTSYYMKWIQDTIAYE